MKILFLVWLGVITTSAYSIEGDRRICLEKTENKFTNTKSVRAKEYFEECLEKMGDLSEDSANEPSLAARNGKRYSVDIGGGGRNSGPIEEKIGFSYFLDPNNLILVNIISLNGENEETIDNSDGIKVGLGIATKFEGSGVNFLFKHFEGNSFYVAGGLDYTELKGKFGYAKDSLFSAEDIELGTIRKFSLDIRIGNQWQWENFTLGTDWVGYHLTLHEESKLADQYPTNADSAKKFKNSIKSDFTILRYYLGWTL